MKAIRGGQHKGSKAKRTSRRASGQPIGLIEAVSEHDRRCADLRRALADAQANLQKGALILANGCDGVGASKQMAYQELVFRIRKAVADLLPPDATVLVVSKGDPELIKLGGRQAWHFPRTENGMYSGCYPADSDAAIAHLEELRSKGASHLIFPSTAFWWLDFYEGFRQHLEAHYTVAARDPRTYVAFALRQQEQNACAGNAELGSATRLLTTPPTATTANGKQYRHGMPDETDLRIELAETLFELAELSDAKRVLLEGLQYDPGNPHLLSRLAESELGLGNEAAANRYATEALAQAPGDQGTVCELARLFSLRGRSDIAEQWLTRLVATAPSAELALSELALLYCRQLESQTNPPDSALVARFIAFLASPVAMQSLAAELQLRIAEVLAEVSAIEPSMQCLAAALRRLSFNDGCVQDFVLRALRPAVSERSLVPFHDRRSLAAFLTHMGNGFASVHCSSKAITCYELARAASTDMHAAEFNRAFIAMASGSVSLPLKYLSKCSRSYADEAAQVCWPTQQGQPWPYAAFDLSAAFESLKPANVSWPRVTVITPSFNQAAYVEETILSVLHQNYPALEYIVVDGCSTDGTVDILRRYERQITRLIVEPDQGQTDAINKGLQRATGELLLWTNSDDMLAPGALFMLALAYLQEQADVIAGFCFEHSLRRFQIINLPAVTQHTFNASCLGDLFEYWLQGHYFYQPEVAFSRRILERVGGALDKQLYFTMDYDFWLKCATAGGRVAVIHWPVGLFRRHDAQKTAHLDHTIIEQGAVRDRYIVPQPCFERTLDIRQRLARAFARPEPRVSVISTRASKIFSPDTGRELREELAGDGLRATFYDRVEDEALREADLVILLVHIYQERVALRKLREAGCDVPIAGWLWDNHHHVFENHKTASDLDVCIPGHAFAGSYLRSGRYLSLPAVPLCVTQWTAAQGRQFFERYAYRPRFDALYGGFIRYSMASKRNQLITRLVEQGMQGVYFLEEHALDRYFGLPLEERFEQWASHKVSLCLPLDGDLSQRLFDALVAGQVPLVPRDVYDLDHVITPDLQEALPIIRFDSYEADAVMAAYDTARRRFDQQGASGIRRRHGYSLEHMFVPRIRTILCELKGVAGFTP